MNTSILRLLIAATMAASLTACASIKPKLLCTQSQRDAITQEATDIGKARQKIEHYKNGGWIPDQGTSFLSRNELLANYVMLHNQRLEAFLLDVKDFNETCTGS